MQNQNLEPKTPLAAVLLTALLIGYAWGFAVLVAGIPKGARPSHPLSVNAGHLVQSENEGNRP